MPKHDIQQFSGDLFEQSAYFSGPIRGWSRRDDPESDGEWITIEYESGGRIEFLTASRLVWIEPDQP